MKVETKPSIIPVHLPNDIVAAQRLSGSNDKAMIKAMISLFFYELSVTDRGATYVILQRIRKLFHKHQKLPQLIFFLILCAEKKEAKKSHTSQS